MVEGDDADILVRRRLAYDAWVPKSEERWVRFWKSAETPSDSGLSRKAVYSRYRTGSSDAFHVKCFRSLSPFVTSYVAKCGYNISINPS